MTLNEIFRRSGEPTYYTPMAVVGQLVNQEGGTVVIGNPPFAVEKPKRWWKKSIRFFGHWYVTFSNCRVKKRLPFHQNTHKLSDNIREMKAYKYKQNGGKCPHCGREFDMQVMEMHHVVPWARFPEFRGKKANMILLCHDCHKEIHCNPWRNIELMKAKAEEFGIDLNERYDTTNDCPQC